MTGVVTEICIKYPGAEICGITAGEGGEGSEICILIFTPYPTRQSAKRRYGTVTVTARVGRGRACLQRLL